MDLVLMPWQALRNNLNDFEGWTNSMQSCSRIDKMMTINPVILKTINKNEPLYRDPKDPRNRISSKKYLNQKIRQDGPWGVMLIQASDRAGSKPKVNKRSKYKSPNDITECGEQHFKLNGLAIDNLGVFEWLALTFQESTNKLSSSPNDASMLLANRIESLTGNYFRDIIPWAYYDKSEDRWAIQTIKSHWPYESARVRLAIA